MRWLFLSRVFPEVNSSAAGVRLAEFLKVAVGSAGNGSALHGKQALVDQTAAAEAARGGGESKVHFFCTSSSDGKASYVSMLEKLGVRLHHGSFNQVEALEKCVHDAKPDVVVYDTFVLEEAFGWMVRRSAPSAMHVIDMQDFHALRRCRERAVLEQGASIAQAFAMMPTCLDSQALAAANGGMVSSKSAMLERELGSILRSDLTVVCGKREADMLQYNFNIPATKLTVSPLLFDTSPKDKHPRQQQQQQQQQQQREEKEEQDQFPSPRAGFQDRQDFCFLGGFRHLPNKDCVHWMHSKVWPRLRERIPSAKLDIYGSYMDRESSLLGVRTPGKWGKNSKYKQNGFAVRGPLDNLRRLAAYRVMLAPVRFGAGIKGKVIDAWAHGVPVITTPIGSESIGWSTRDNSNALGGWGGFPNCETADQVVDAAVRMYLEKDLWEQANANARTILDTELDETAMKQQLLSAIHNKQMTFMKERETDYVAAVLNENKSRASEYMSRWISIKQANT